MIKKIIDIFLLLFNNKKEIKSEIVSYKDATYYKYYQPRKRFCKIEVFFQNNEIEYVIIHDDNEIVYQKEDILAYKREGDKCYIVLDKATIVLSNNEPKEIIW